MTAKLIVTFTRFDEASAHMSVDVENRQGLFYSRIHVRDFYDEEAEKLYMKLRFNEEDGKSK